MFSYTLIDLQAGVQWNLITPWISCIFSFQILHRNVKKDVVIPGFFFLESNENWTEIIQINHLFIITLLLLSTRYYVK